MSNELAINSTQEGERIALLKGKRLVELHLEKSDTQFKVGDLYLGSVKKVATGLNAAFIDIGYEKDAFLHYLDLGPQVKSLNKYVKDVQIGKQKTDKLDNFQKEDDIDKNGKISQVLSRGQQIVVQVVKEPISTKGPRLSCEISLPGRYIVLVPFSNSVSVSKKIVDKEERKRLVRLLNSIKPKSFGIIIRTVAEKKEVAELDRDLRDLVTKWETTFKNLTTARPGDRIYGEEGKTSSILRDLLNDSFDTISVDTKKLYEDIKDYIKRIAPEKEKIVKHFNGKVPIFEKLGIEKQIKSLFGTSVSIQGGGYLIIEHTEAMHVIDVNSGNKSNANSEQEITALNVNLEAAKEIARQLRLRDMGGIIVVDFIDMRKAENRQRLYEAMKEEMKTDRSKYTILPLSKFGLMQITRQRVRQETNVEDSGKKYGSESSIAIAEKIESNIEYLITKQGEKGLSITLHPFLYAYFTKGVFSTQFSWWRKYKIWIKLQPDSSLDLKDFSIFNKKGTEIKI